MPLIDFGSAPADPAGINGNVSRNGMNSGTLGTNLGPKGGSLGPLRPPPPPANVRRNSGSKSTTTGSSGGSEDFVDPFAPFDDYEETPGYGEVASRRGQYYSVVPNELYRSPPTQERDSGLSLGSISISSAPIQPHGVPDDPGINVTTRSLDSGRGEDTLQSQAYRYSERNNGARDDGRGVGRETEVGRPVGLVVTPPRGEDGGERTGQACNEPDPFEVWDFDLDNSLSLVPSAIKELAGRRSYKDIYKTLGSTPTPTPPPQATRTPQSPGTVSFSGGSFEGGRQYGQEQNSVFTTSPNSVTTTAPRTRDEMKLMRIFDLSGAQSPDRLGTRQTATSAVPVCRDSEAAPRRGVLSGAQSVTARPDVSIMGPTAKPVGSNNHVGNQNDRQNLGSVSDRRASEHQSNQRQYLGGSSNYEYRSIPRPTSSSQLYGIARHPQAPGAAFSSAAGVISRQRGPQATGASAAVAQFPSRPASMSATAYDAATMNATWSPQNFAANFAAGGQRNSQFTSNGSRDGSPLRLALPYSHTGARPATPPSSGCLWGAGNAVMMPSDRAQSVPDVSSVAGLQPVSGVVLDMFDPLSSKPSADLVAAVQRLAPFVQSTERCSVVLKRCGMDVQSAVKELKIQKLVDMGLVTNRVRAVEILDKSGWDVNSAAEAALS